MEKMLASRGVCCYTERMKHLRFLCALLLAFAVLSPAPAFAAKKKAKDSVTALGDANPVMTGFKKLKSFNGKPNPKAKFYFYLCSASWCGPCQKEMPEIVEAHKKMKKDGRCDIILIGHDKTLDDAKAYLKSHKAKFAGVWCKDDKIDELPGNQPVPGIPYTILVDRSGKTIFVQHASVIKDWKEVIDRVEAQAEQPAADTGDTTAPAAEGETDDLGGSDF